MQGISLNFYFISNKYNIIFLEEKSQTSYDKYNLRGSKIKIDESKYFGKSKINENILKENIRILRKLYIDEHELLIGFLNGFTAYLLVILMLSFCISDKPGQFHFNFLNIFAHIRHPLQILMIPFILALSLVIYILTYGLAELLGKKKAQYCTLIFSIMVEAGMSIACFILEKDEEAYILIGLISSVLAFFNFLTILIPNLPCGEKLRSQDFEVTNNQSQNSIMNNRTDNYNNNNNDSSKYKILSE